MHELSLLAREDLVERLSDVLLDELHAVCVSIEDADDDGQGDGLFGEPEFPLSNEFGDEHKQPL